MTILVARVLSILLCLALSTASFSAPFTHFHESGSDHSPAHSVHRHFSLHHETFSGAGSHQVEDSDPPAHYIDTFWLEAGTTITLPALVAEGVVLPPPLPDVEVVSDCEFPNWRGPPPGDPYGLRSPPPAF